MSVLDFIRWLFSKPPCAHDWGPDGDHGPFRRKCHLCGEVQFADITYDLVDALDDIDEICSEDPSNPRIARILAVVRTALDAAEHHARLRAMGAFNDE